MYTYNLLYKQEETPEMHIKESIDLIRCFKGYMQRRHAPEIILCLAQTCGVFQRDFELLKENAPFLAGMPFDTAEDFSSILEKLSVYAIYQGISSSNLCKIKDSIISLSTLLEACTYNDSECWEMILGSRLNMTEAGVISLLTFLQERCPSYVSQVSPRNERTPILTAALERQSKKVLATLLAHGAALPPVTMIQRRRKQGGGHMYDYAYRCILDIYAALPENQVAACLMQTISGLYANIPHRPGELIYVRIGDTPQNCIYLALSLEDPWIDENMTLEAAVKATAAVYCAYITQRDALGVSAHKINAADTHFLDCAPAFDMCPNALASAADTTKWMFTRLPEECCVLRACLSKSQIYELAKISHILYAVSSLPEALTLLASQYVDLGEIGIRLPIHWPTVAERVADARFGPLVDGPSVQAQERMQLASSRIVYATPSAPPAMAAAAVFLPSPVVRPKPSSAASAVPYLGEERRLS